MSSGRLRRLRQHRGPPPWIARPEGVGRPSFHPYHLLRRKAEVLDFLGRWLEARELYQRNREAALAIALPDLAAQSQVDVATVLHGLSRYQEAKELLEEAISFYQRSGDDLGLSRALLKLGNAFVELADYRRAEECYLLVIDACRRTGNLTGLSAAYGNMGNVHYFCDRLDLALEFYQKDLELALQMDNKIGLAATYRNLGGVYYTRNELPKALEWLRKQQALCLAIGDVQGQGASWLVMGEVHRKMGNSEQARTCYAEAAKIFRRLGDRKWMGHVLAVLSEINTEEGSLHLALKQNAQACDIFREHGIAYYLGYYLCQRAEMLISLGGPPADAAPLLDEAEAIGKHIGSREILFNVGIARAKAAARLSADEAKYLLEIMLDDGRSDEETAAVCFELFKLTANDYYRSRALELYGKLYSATGALEFKIAVEKLRDHADKVEPS